MSCMAAGTVVNKGAIELIGIAVRTSNAAEAAGNGAIGALWQRFREQEIAARIADRSDPHGVVAVYCDYASDESGAYTVIVGCQVTAIRDVPAGMVSRSIAAAHYLQLPTARGALPGIGIEAWGRIWQDGELKARRTFTADLELYGPEASDPQDATFDILIGIKPT